MKYKILLLSFAMSLANGPLYAQAIDTKTPLNIERVFANPDLEGPKAVSPKLSPDGTMISYLKPKTSNVNVQDLWGVLTSGGEPFLLLDADKLSSADKELSEAEKSRRERMRVSSRGVVAFDWAENSKTLLVPVDGDIYLLDAKTQALSRITETVEDEIDAKLSPDGKYLSFVRDGQLFVKDINNNREMAQSPKAEGTVFYATADFIAQEEQGRFTGYWWSPNSDKIAYTKTDEANVEIIARFEISGNGAKTIAQRYPRAGMPNATNELYVKTLGNDEIVKIDLGANPDIYLGRVDWSLDGKTLFVQRLSRDQKLLELLEYDVKSGNGKVILSESSDTWVELHDDFKLLKSGGFIWASEKDGNNHLYLYDKNAQLVRQITKGEWRVENIAAIDEAKSLVYFIGNVETPLERNLYSINYKRPAQMKTLGQKGGWWAIKMAKAGNAYIGNFSSPEVPPNAGLYDANGKLLRFIEENALNQSHPYFAHKDRYSQPEFGTIKSDDGQDLHYSILKPVGFDPSKKYPVIVSIYGGPANQVVRKSWIPASTRLLQENGYIVFSLDNRGTPNRSVKFGRAIYKKFGGPDIDDQIKGGKFLQTLDYVDAKKIGIMGWSQGGFVSLMALTAKDTPFAAGIAGAPPTQWDLYDTGYTERYMSMPQENKDGYIASDVLTRLDNLAPNSLLLMHGMADDNVILANTTRVMEALQSKAIPFELMLFPGERHGLKGLAKNKFRWKLYLDFLDRKLK